MCLFTKVGVHGMSRMRYALSVFDPGTGVASKPTTFMTFAYSCTRDQPQPSELGETHLIYLPKAQELTHTHKKVINTNRACAEDGRL